LTILRRLIIYCTFIFAAFASYIIQKGKQRTGVNLVRVVTQIIILILITIVIVVAVPFGIRYVFGVINPFYVVASGSMIPRLNIGDLLIVKYTTDSKGDSSFNNLRVGDIIVFNTPYKTTEGKHKVIVHR
jgi:signal peptidase I